MTTRRFRDPDSEPLDGLYEAMAERDLQPLWRLDGLMPAMPASRGKAHSWRASDLRALGERSGALVPIERGGDRRVLALCNPSLGGRPYATSTLWGAVQHLGPGEVAPAHRHSPGALRFVLEGEGVWTRVEGDAVPMGPGDLVLTPSWTWHEHHNPGSEPMLWFDALDLPLVEALDAVFFEAGADASFARPTPGRSEAEVRFGAAPGLLVAGSRPELRHSPLLAYRWADTEAALAALVARTPDAVASLRYCDPTSGSDVMPTMRCEVHRVPPGSLFAPERRVGSSIWVVVGGACRATVDGERHDLEAKDLLAVPSWAELSFSAPAGADLFSVSDAPAIEALGLDLPGKR